jgi:hypothetical protein
MAKTFYPALAIGLIIGFILVGPVISAALEGSGLLLVAVSIACLALCGSVVSWAILRAAATSDRDADAIAEHQAL